jgi:DNA helicase II / ATP-dependent DNA helicase PcrA
VAVTRARDVLEVSAPLRYHHHRHRLDDRHSYAPLSRFLSPDVRALMDAEHAEPASGEPGTASATAGGGEDGVAAVDRFLADLWA